MATIAQEPRSPVLANLVVLVGFAAIFATFVIDSPAPVIIGVVLVLAGGIWAGLAGSGGGPSDGGAA